MILNNDKGLNQSVNYGKKRGGMTGKQGAHHQRCKKPLKGQR